MKQELEEQLIAKYKSFFRDARQNNPGTTPQTSCMFWGLDVGDGWYNILDSACRLIESHELHNAPAEYQPASAAQVKEKFGGLRLYIRGGDEYVEGVIAMAELMSEKTCEICGAPGHIRGRGWLACRCDDCEGTHKSI
jgi:hypothetical protein